MTVAMSDLGGWVGWCLAGWVVGWLGGWVVGWLGARDNRSGPALGGDTKLNNASL